MITVQGVADLRSRIAGWKREGRRIAFVPTMGNLHAGHLRLVQVARERGDVVVASIYVNPLQFGPAEDFAAYPRTPQEDEAALRSVNTDLLFVPREVDVYPRGREAQTRVEVPGLGDVLCGAHRPGHFRGVTTVVNRLLNVVSPDIAVFGKKDYQQLMLIRSMVSDLGMPVEIIGADTVREPDGLAMSSRNSYLSPSERSVAPGLYRTLCASVDRIQKDGATLVGEIEDGAQQALTRLGFHSEYVAVRRQADLGTPKAGDRELVVLAAARIGRTRLIDNLEVSLP